MMEITLQDGLAYVTASLWHGKQQITLKNILLDTGSAGTVFSADKLLPLGVQLEPADPIHRIRGVGGTEFVFSKAIDRLAIGTLAINQFEVEIGAMDYGFELDGIIGLDFLTQVGAVVDLKQWVIYPSPLNVV